MVLLKDETLNELTQTEIISFDGLMPRANIKATNLRMKPFVKAILFLVLLTFIDFATRQGLIAFFIPFQLPFNANILIFYTLFAISAWYLTKAFGKSENTSLDDLGISFNADNRFDFLYGFLIGVVLWGIVSFIQALSAGFSWELRPSASFINIIYGLLFIFVADLGTELYTRGYPLTRFKDSFGAMSAIWIMVIFVSLKTFIFSIGAHGAILFYSILIPALHTIFFSIIYFKTKRLGAAVGVHTGANFITISIFDLRIEQANQAIPAGLFQSNLNLETVSIHTLQWPWVLMATAFSIIVYFWWRKE